MSCGTLISSNSIENLLHVSTKETMALASGLCRSSYELNMLGCLTVGVTQTNFEDFGQPGHLPSLVETMLFEYGHNFLNVGIKSLQIVRISLNCFQLNPSRQCNNND